MSNLVADYVLDNGLTPLHNLATGIYICSSDPVTYTDATSTLALGNQTFAAGSAVGASGAGSPNGRQVATSSISAGSITATGTAAKWAIVDSNNSRLLVNGSLAGGVAVSSGNTFSLPSFTVRLPSQ